MSAKADNIHSFTEKYFHDEIVRLRQAWGTKDFWAMSDEKRQKMIDGLSFVYLNIVNEDGSTPTSEQIEQWAGIFQSTLTEYSRREFYMKTRI